ncbi:MAG: cadmium-translocating P-type ATPase [Oscillospiraceae bacterium]|nr:cadmium-translocating P-type ATPase [Oscillospiraceae bacterium]
MTRRQKKMLLRILVSAALMILLGFLPIQGWVRFAAYMLPYLVVGWDILWRAALGIKNKQVFDENFLMAVATIGALVLAVTGNGDYTEAIAVMLFYQTGELFQSYAVGKSRRSIAQLMDIRPDYANRIVGDDLETVDPEEVEIGSVLEVRPGEKVPIDGIVLSGSSSLNTVALTGESIPRDVAPGDAVISGCINLSGALRIRTTKEFGESTVAKILDLVENASSRKSRSEAFISRFAAIYTPAVCLSALTLAVIPPLIWGNWSLWLYRALSFLVVSCPCALVISIPMAFFGGLGGASNAGILIKGSNYLEALAKVDTVVFDKTGTLTQGVFQVSGIRHAAMEEDKILQYAALAEIASSHPISKSLMAAWGGVADRSRVCDIQEISGEGVTAMVDGVAVAVGNRRLMARFGLEAPADDAMGTTVHVAVDGKYAGAISISDALKPAARDAMAALKNAGIRRTVMLTGDNAAAASAIASQLGITEFHASLLPGQKVEHLEALLEGKSGRGTLAFVGDGINDAPVLSRADIGIAMGALGSDAAIESADVVLMDDDPRKIAKAIRIARKCIGIVYQNTVFAIGIKLLCLVLTALGITGMWLAIFADVGVMVLAVLNAIRALFVKHV